MSTRADNTVQEPLPSVLNECLSIDLEVDVSTAHINARAAWRGAPTPESSSPLDMDRLMLEG